ncbi:SDR family oxidoreductase [Mesorhizobium sp. NBSH29]|uniref:3-oxoacyl-ACP reductase family protein n=1 Tax=Mesorhizobium sp. NBSH29 TaxID=2654249 RepID=UPI0018963ECB|nr:3-oxoacyl-ACP reductase family protein [Mesorhizobium sp. NBSH29]QPC87984.1 SDR family oxidoreductase [Mesorhizobium sp. NBSH29]
MTTNDLTGKVALVTGGSRGIGAAIARHLALQGARVAITYVHGKQLAGTVVTEIQAVGGKALAIKADNRDAGSVTAAVEKTVEVFGRLDILVNSAGIWRAAPVDALSLEDFDDSISVNLRAAFVASQAASKHLGEGGRIISIASNLADRVTSPGLAAYSASKAGLVALTKALARDLGPRGITVNAVNPGSTNTDMNPANGPYSDGQRAAMAIQRYGEPGDIASLVGWLAGPQSRFVTGAAITADGGANV